jgi:sensor histidine kinase YesM
VQCHVENSNFPKPESDKSGSGIGLNNLRKRLELLYPSAYKLSINDRGSTHISALILELGTVEK